MIRRPPRSTRVRSSAASDVYKRQGLCFGVGMTLASGCANRTLVRVGGGNLRSVVVFIYLGFAALVTLRGILGAFRVNVLQAPAVTIQFEHGQTLPALLSGIGGLSSSTLQLAIACVIGLALSLIHISE